MANILLCSFAALLLAFFRCYLVFALGQAFDSFLRLGFLNDSLLFFPLFLVPPAAKEGKGDCEYPLRTVRFAPGVPVCNKLPTSSRTQARDLRRSPYALLGFSYYPFVTPGTACQGVGYGGGLLSLVPSIIGGRFYGSAVDMVALLPCLEHAIALAGCGRSLFDC